MPRRRRSVPGHPHRPAARPTPDWTGRTDPGCAPATSRRPRVISSRGPGRRIRRSVEDAGGPTTATLVEATQVKATQVEATQVEATQVKDDRVVHQTTGRRGFPRPDRAIRGTGSSRLPGNGTSRNVSEHLGPYVEREPDMCLTVTGLAAYRPRSSEALEHGMQGKSGPGDGTGLTDGKRSDTRCRGTSTTSPKATRN